MQPWFYFDISERKYPLVDVNHPFYLALPLRPLRPLWLHFSFQGNATAEDAEGSKLIAPPERQRKDRLLAGLELTVIYKRGRFDKRLIDFGQAFCEISSIG